jgi:hypothetical protein
VESADGEACDTSRWIGLTYPTENLSLRAEGQSVPAGSSDHDDGPRQALCRNTSRHQLVKSIGMTQHCIRSSPICPHGAVDCDCCSVKPAFNGPRGQAERENIGMMQSDGERWSRRQMKHLHAFGQEKHSIRHGRMDLTCRS